MTAVAEFIVRILGRIASGLFTTYIVRLVEKIMHKNNRQECEKRLFCVNIYLLIFPSSSLFL
ncbi:MAG: hypothetical protein PUC12_12560 [Clostridiales bacterium]|nr:hypothetical protein [Clostridiales bacterium]